MAELNTIVPVVIYLSLSFLAALWARKQSQKTSDSHGFIEEYFIGGRSMGGFVLAMSIIASYTSASSFVGGPGVAYKLGLSWVLLAMIQVPTTFLTLGVLGKRFAIMARKTRSVTLTDFLRARYRSDAVVVLCSLALLVFFMAAMLAQFIGGARLFQAVTGYPYIVGLALFGLTVILYTAVGGFRAVVLTDAIQGMVMVFASVVVLVAVVNAGGGVDFTPFADRVRAVLLAWYPGQEGGRALADILTGRTNPSGRLPISIERRVEENPAFGSYYPNVFLFQDSPLRRISYDEGVFVGYRGHDRNGTELMYPFGYGLSYTTFEYGDLELTPAGDGWRVSFSVKNTGKRAGTETPQVYVGDCAASVPRPEKELKGYERITLAPGERKRVEIALDSDAFAYYDMNRHDLRLEPGEFTISVGASSRDIRLKDTICIKH